MKTTALILMVMAGCGSETHAIDTDNKPGSASTNQGDKTAKSDPYINESDLSEATITFNTHAGPGDPAEDIIVSKSHGSYALKYLFKYYTEHSSRREKSIKLRQSDFKVIWDAIEKNNVLVMKTQNKDLPPPDGGMYNLTVEWKLNNSSIVNSNGLVCGMNTDTCKHIEPVITEMKKLSQ